MSQFFEDTLTGLLQAVSIDKGYIPMVEIEDLPARTLRAETYEGQDKPSIKVVTKPSIARHQTN